MNDFFTGLQFLTRIQLRRQSEWSAESFGRSVRYFPLVGLIIGAVLAAIYHVAATVLPVHVVAALLIAAEIIVTGALHCDGYMDTADGIFSGRSRERILEIMKDSRVGANGVVAFGILMLLKWTLYIDLPASLLPAALLVSPVIGRFCMVLGITAFPYARPDGIGKAFAQHAGKDTLFIAAVITFALAAFIGKTAVAGLLAAIVFTLLFARYITNILGGLTGDVYGAVTEIAQVVVLLTLLVLREWR